jgi:regulator of replication initiation timing
MSSPDTKSTFYWCRSCRRATEPVESDQGLSGLRCGHCHSLRIELKGELPPIPQHLVQPLPELLPEPDQGKPRQKLHRLESSKRNLNKLCAEGYWFCHGCEHVTELKAEEDCCMLCNSNDVERMPGIFEEAQS